MEITGRLAKDAVVRKVKDGREVVRFTLVLNDRYRTKGGETKTVATFIDCSYWISSKVVRVLTKGNIVTIYGRIGLDAYKTNEGEPKTVLTFHVNDIKVLAFHRPDALMIDAPSPQEVTDDLPF